MEEKVGPASEGKKGKAYGWPMVAAFLGTLVVVVFGVPYMVKQFSHEARESAKDAVNFITDKFSTHEAFAAELISLSNQKTADLGVVKSNATMIFRGVVWRGDWAGGAQEFFECVDDRGKFTNINAVAGQVCEVQAIGTFELRYYVDMSDPNKWNSAYDGESKTITITAPPLQASLPAEIRSPEMTTIKDSISIDEDSTKEKLRGKIPRLKKQTAERNIPNMLDTARLSLRDHFQKWFYSKYKGEFEMVNPNIVVRFENEAPQPAPQQKL